MMPQENILARYKILHELGRGATSAVYAARDRKTGAVVALKRIDPALGQSDASFVERFLKQARAATSLAHRNIVRIHEAGEAAGTAYIAMEMLEGETLRKILDDGPLQVSRAIQIAHGIASGLAYAHLQGVVHGGIKPSSVIVLRSGEAKIDFGAGRPEPSYMSPEQLRGDPIDHRSDIFSLGALFYELLTHQPPLQGDSPKPSELNEHVPRSLDAIVLHMLAAKPAERMPGVPILVNELERLKEGLGLAADAASNEPKVNAPPPAPEPPQPEFRYEPHYRARPEPWPVERPSRSSSAFFAALALVLALISIGLTGFMALRSGFIEHTGYAELDAFMDRLSGRGERNVVVSRAEEAPPTAPEASPQPTPPPVAEAPKEPVTTPSAPPTEQPLSSVPTTPEPTPEPVAPEPAAKIPEPQPGGVARLILAVSPRGELYIDGEHQGTTPPDTMFELQPGMHRIEVRSGSRRPYLTYMTVQAGDVRRIQHDFNAKVFPPPG
jgi:serine/threonine-protein kinase